MAASNQKRPIRPSGRPMNPPLSSLNGGLSMFVVASLVTGIKCAAPDWGNIQELGRSNSNKPCRHSRDDNTVRIATDFRRAKPALARRLLEPVERGKGLALCACEIGQIG